MTDNKKTIYKKNGLSELDYKKHYKELKRTLGLLIYEKEIFQQTLKNSQRKLLKTKQNKSMLLDKLIHYERDKLISSDDELTESSTDDDCIKPKPRKRKNDNTNNSSTENSEHSISQETWLGCSNQHKKRKSSSKTATEIINGHDCSRVIDGTNVLNVFQNISNPKFHFFGNEQV